ncbi:MAG: phosphoenolpyruvate carboxykinase (ATP), partial [Erysipelotrichaceae bacterium]|nr:phosphoenolpyruvate carboxykinase (ATP) [Erysipelotrichaceae bacterium]
MIKAKKIYINLDSEELLKIALEKGEGKLAANGALVVNTGKYTGRSPDDKFIVDDELTHDTVAWGKVNRPTDKKTFNALKEKLKDYLSDKEAYVFRGYAGADIKYRKKFTVYNELASQNLFVRDLLIRPTKEELENYGEPDYTIICCPGFKCVPEKDNTHSEAAIMIDYSQKEILIAGTAYAGEIKKSVFSTMNYCMTEENVLPMH